MERDEEEDDTGDVDNASLDDTSAPSPKKKTRAKKDVFLLTNFSLSTFDVV